MAESRKIGFVHEYSGYRRHQEYDARYDSTFMRIPCLLIIFMFNVFLVRPNTSISAKQMRSILWLIIFNIFVSHFLVCFTADSFSS